MAWLVKPFETYEVDAAIAKGQAVMFGSSNKRVVKCTAASSLCIGVAQNAAVNVGDLVEVVHSGGAKALAKAGITKGDRLGVNADASIQKVAAQGDQAIGFAMDDASAGDLVSIFVAISGPAYASQA